METERRVQQPYRDHPEITGPYPGKRARSAGAVTAPAPKAQRKTRPTSTVRLVAAPGVEEKPSSSTSTSKKTVVRRSPYTDFREDEKRSATSRDTSRSWLIDENMTWYLRNKGAVRWEKGFDLDRYGPCKKHARNLDEMNWDCWFCRRSLWRFVNEIDN